MKKVLSVLLAMALVLGLAACGQEAGTTESESTTSVESTEAEVSSEEAEVSSEVSEEVSEEQSEEASESAEATEETDEESSEAQTATETYESDVLVIGGGGTGLVAALSAAEEGAQVILLEKQASYGGATSMSSGKIPASGTAEQEEAGVEDSVEANFLDIYRAGAFSQNKELLHKAAEEATPVKEWLENYGIEWYLETESVYYGQSTFRIHVAEGSGAGIVNALVEGIEANDNIQSFTNMSVNGLITEEGAVVGAYVEKDGELYEFRANSVVLGTSGFGANREMVEYYTPSIVNAVPNVAPGATGEGIVWGQDLGARVAAMNAFQAYAPISFETHASLGSAFLDNGGILVNKSGHRFINEYVGYSPLGTAIVNQEDYYAWMIWDSNIQDMEIGALQAMNDDELKTADTPEELAALMDVDADRLVEEFELYQEGIKEGEDYLNRTRLPESFEAPFYAIKVTGDFRHTQGGLVINPETAEVLKEDGTAITNLYAGGGVTEGFSSNGDSNYMAGNGLLQAFVYGRIAGISAANNVSAAVDADTFKGQEEKIAAVASAQPEIVASDEQYTDGEYKGVGKGHGGDVEVTVVVADGKISEVTIDNHSETAGISDAAIEGMPERIVQANGPEVDTISGATETSNAVIEAVQDALKDAK